jgi:hypothetical protein
MGVGECFRCSFDDAAETITALWVPRITRMRWNIRPVEAYAFERNRSGSKIMTHSNHGIVRDKRGEEQPADKDRAQTAHQTRPNNSETREATRDPKQDSTSARPGSDH